MVLQNYQNFTEMTSNMIYIVAHGVGLKCPRKIHLNTQCQPCTDVPTKFWKPQTRLQWSSLFTLKYVHAYIQYNSRTRSIIRNVSLIRHFRAVEESFGLPFWSCIAYYLCRCCQSEEAKKNNAVHHTAVWYWLLHDLVRFCTQFMTLLYHHFFARKHYINTVHCSVEFSNENHISR